MLKEFYTALYTQCSTICTTRNGISAGLTGNYANIFHIDAFQLEHVMSSPVGTVYYHKYMVQIDIHSDYDQATAFALAQKMKMKLQKNFFSMSTTRIVNPVFVSMIPVDEGLNGWTYKLTWNYWLGN